MPKFLEMIDPTNKFVIPRKNLFSMPFRILVIGRAGSGKSNILGNLLLLKEMYKDVFNPEDIYIFSGSLEGDKKLKIIIEQLDIPDENLFDEYDESALSDVYDILVEEYNESIARKEKPTQKLIVFDDLSFTGALRGQSKQPMINKIFMNGRKFLVNTVVIAQKYSDVSTGARENATGIILFKSTNKQLDLIEHDMNYLKDKKQFLDMVKDNTKGKHDFIIMDFMKESPYRTKDYKVICTCNQKECKCSKD
jgi:nucleoside-triphosphatase THEP1